MMEDRLTELPRGWVWTRLGDIGIVAAGGTPSTKNENNFGGNVPWITPADLSNFKGKFISRGSRNISEKGLKSSSAVLLPAGSILFSSRAPIGYVVIASNPISTNQGFKNLILSKDIFNEYVFYYLKASKALAESLASGTTFLEISAYKFAQVPIPLPPFPEQHRIVAKIEELFTRLDAGVEALKKIKAQLKRYRQSVLKYAFEGKLTQEWREANKGKLEPASALLERIKEQRRKEGKYKELPPIDTSELPELPEGWVWTTLGEVTNYVDTVNPKVKPNKEFVYLDIASIDNSQQKITNPKNYLGKDAPSRARQLVKSGDILFSTVRTYLKNIAMVSEIYDGQIASTGFCVIRPLPKIQTRLIFWLVQTDDFLNPLNQLQRGTSYPAVRDSDVFQQIIPLPPFHEQQKIVEEIENRLSIADNMEKVAEQSLKQSERLRQSILKRAFEGKLVPQDPTDEPADKLLERIKEERLKQEKERKLKNDRRKIDE